MSDIILNLKLTDTEIIHIMDALDARIEDLGDTLTFGDDPMIQDQIGEMRDLAADLFEAISRHDDGWNDAAPEAAADLIHVCGDGEHPDLLMDPVDFAAKHDQNKGSSRAAQRRQEQNERMMKGTATPTDPDTWPLNDPADW